MAIKEIQTRIALKYDLYSAWTTAPGKDLVLLKGELGICEIPSANNDSNVAPTVLFKVGDGKKTFEALPWASAKAADVYSWAKASDVVYNQTAKTITFVNGNADGSDKVITFNYVTLAEVQAITNGLDSRITALEGKFTGTESVDAKIATAKQEAIEAAASDATAKAGTAEDNAKAYTDEREIEIKNYADGKLATAVGTINAKDAEQDTAIGNKLDKATYEAYIAGKEMSDEALKGYADGVAGAAKDAAIAAAKTETETQISTLVTSGQVKTNTDAIAQNKADITAMDAAYKKAVSDEAKARDDADKAIDERLDAVEAFFATAEGETLDGALDTLKEIQDYLNGEGTATDGLIGRITTAEGDIDALETRAANLENRAGALEAADATINGNITTLQQITSGYTGEGAIQDAIEAAASAASVADGKAVAAQAAAEAAQGTADAVKAAVEHGTTGLVAIKAIADRADAKSIANAGRLDTAENEIDALQAIVSAEGGNSNAKLREDITALQTLTAGFGNTTIKAAVDAAATAAAEAAGAVTELANGQVATNKTNIETLDGRVTAIANDYVKATDLVNDFYVFNCGSSTEVTHEVPKAE